MQANLSPTDLEIRRRLKNDFAYYAPRCLKIRSERGEIVPFRFNESQQYFHDKVEEQRRLTGKVRVIALKGRQLGISTYVGGRGYHYTTNSFGKRAFILTHESDATKNLYEMTLRYHEHCPEIVKPRLGRSNVKELHFDLLDSGYKVGTAGNKGVGRSSTIQFFHGSEVPLWENASEHAAGILQAIPSIEETEVFLEGTAKGQGNFFHKQWQLAEAGQSDFIAVFMPWFWKKEYRVAIDRPLELTDKEIELSKLYGLTQEQLAWRRAKIINFSASGLNGEKLFCQEYPCNSVEAFQTTGDDGFISPDLVMRARKCTAEKYGPLIVGVDPARFGDDSTSIIFRQGRVAYNLQSFNKKDNMEIVGIVYRIIKEHSPDRVFVDVGGGAGIIDRLHEMGFKKIVIAVNFASEAMNKERYGNKRAEMWGDTRDWLNEYPCQIPDDDALHADLCAPKYKHLSMDRIFLEKKADMKTRGIRSPDRADALCLTFAFPFVKEQTRKVSVIQRGNFMGH